MPYGSTDDLPESVKKSLPSHAQEIFMKAFNSAYEDTCKDRSDREACANAIAWSAVKRGYEKSATGEWLKKTQKCCLHGECQKFQKSEIRDKIRQHDAILQLLNRPVGKFNFPVEPFIKTVEKWEGTPIVFSERPLQSDWPDGMTSKHPNFEVYSTALKDEDLLAANGAIIGEIHNPRITKEGRPKLMGSLEFSSRKAQELYEKGIIGDETFSKTELALQKAMKLLDEGNLSHSTGFTCPHDESYTLYNEVVPNHLLTFEENRKNYPIDRGAVIVNKEAEMPDEDDKKTQSGRVISAKNKAKLKSIMDSIVALFTELSPEEDDGKSQKSSPPGEEDDQKTQKEQMMTADLQKELEETKAALSAKDTEIETYKGQVTTLSSDLEKYKAEEKDRDWARIKAKLPPGLVHTPEDEKALREKFEKNNSEFSDIILDLKREPEKKEEGQKFNNKGEMENDPAAASLELRRITGRLPRMG